jgi:putative addiction module component (TIGR02574 family)
MGSVAKKHQQLFEEALRLPPVARADLAGELIDSLDVDDVDADAEAEWGAAIRRRLQDVDSGTVTAVPWIEARRRILEGS